MHGKLHPKPRTEPLRRRIAPSWQDHPAGRIEAAELHRREHRNQPVAIGGRVIIEEKNELAARLIHGTIAREARPLTWFEDVANGERRRGIGGRLHDTWSIVGRGIVDDDAFD